MMASLFKGPAVHPFVECPNCKHLLEYGAKNCPRCREEIDPAYALIDAMFVHYNTQAISLANTIKTAEPGAIISIAVSIYAYFLGIPTLFALVLGVPAISLFFIIIWFIRFSAFELGDEEYKKSKRDMWSSLILWLGLFSVQLLVLIYLTYET